MRVPRRLVSTLSLSLALTAGSLGCGESEDKDRATPDRTAADQAADSPPAASQAASPAPGPPDEAKAETTQGDYEMEGFSYLREGLAGMPRPGRAGDLDADLDFLSTESMTLLVSLTDEAPEADTLSAHGMQSLHLPVEDFHAPTQDQLREFVTQARATIEDGGKVGVHCAAGKGRTGTFLAAWVISEGSSASEAIAAVREARPGSIETPEQEAALETLAEYYTDNP